jgi:hypothetical protein
MVSRVTGGTTRNGNRVEASVWLLQIRYENSKGEAGEFGPIFSAVIP